MLHLTINFKVYFSHLQGWKDYIHIQLKSSRIRHSNCKAKLTKDAVTSFMKHDRYKNDKLICYQKQFCRFQWVFFLQVLYVWVLIFYVTDGKRKGNCWVLSKSKRPFIYTCPSIKSKADIFPEDTHVNDVVSFLTVKQKQ